MFFLTCNFCFDHNNICLYQIIFQPTSSLNVDSDEIIGVHNTIHRQILNCQVEDWAIDDAIYILGDAVRRGAISTEVYLKRVRNFSRKQFYARALMDKCREVSGLNIDQTDCSSSSMEEPSKEGKNKATVKLL